MYKLEDSILDISSNKYEYLINLANVNGVGLGYKYINGINTFEPCIHVLVENKINSKYISQNNLIPINYMGLKTDVIEIGKYGFYQGETITERYRPLEGGCEILIIDEEDEEDEEDEQKISNGTLGCIVTKVENQEREFYILSNNHVLANFNQNPIGIPIIQTNDIDNPDIMEDIVANLSSFIPIKFIEGDIKPVNFVDCAIAKIIDKSMISNKIIDIGEIKGVVKASLNQKIKKVGASTGLTIGKIITIGATVEIPAMEELKILYKNQLLSDIDGDHGDSGSVVLNEDNEVLGLLVGGGGGGPVLINEINKVLELLNVEIYLG